MATETEATARLVAAALVAGAAFAAEEALDQRLIGPVYSDMKLLGYAVTTRRPWWLLIGFAIHEANSVAFAQIYRRVLGPRLVGPGWLRGLTMAMLENAVLWPLVYFSNAVHPAVRRGTMKPIGGGRDFVAATARHAAFGLVLGALCPVDRRDR